MNPHIPDSIEQPIEQPIEHQNVPQAHQGLHNFLYPAADEHMADIPVVSASDKTLETNLELERWCNDVQNAKVAGVYVVMNGDRTPQFISYSRNVALSLKGHLAQKGADLCAFVTVQSFTFPKRDAMEQLQDEWIAALPGPPPGNVDGTWASTVRDAATQVMSVTEREAYEEKKLKLRRAMADGSLNLSALKAEGEVAQRQDLAMAMNDDNWSAVVREQTQETQT